MTERTTETRATRTSGTQWRLTYSYAPPVEGRIDPRRVIGRVSLRAASHLGRVAYLCWELIRGMKEWRVWIPRAFEQAAAVGYGSLFIVLLTAAFAGGVLSIQAGYQFTGGIPKYYAAGIIVKNIILELAPVLTALILAGRIGARIAAELGTMKVTEQIDALESLGRSSVSHLLLPRVVAGTLMLPVLVIFADLTGVAVGWAASRQSLGISNADFAFGAQFFFEPFDVWYSLTKATFFGLAITLIPCYMGINTKQGAEGVGRATTTAVVAASIVILFLNIMLTQVLLS